MNQYTHLTTVLMCLLLGACSTLEHKNYCDKSTGKNKCHSLVVSKPVGAQSAEKGLLYALPKQQIKFQIKREKVTMKGLEATLKKAMAQEKTLQEGYDKFTSETVEKLKHHHQHVRLDANVASVNHLLEIALIDQKRLADQLLAVKQQIKGIREKLATLTEDRFEDKISMTQLPLLPDQNNVLVARINKTNWSSDTFELNTAQSGLLSGGMGESKGQVDEIFVSLVSAYANVAAMGAPKGGPRSLHSVENIIESHSTEDKEKCDEIKPGSFEFIIDLNDTSFKEKLETQMQNECFGYELKVASTLSPSNCSASDILGKSGEYFDGLLYPRVSVVQFDVYKSTGNQTNTGDNPGTYVKSFFPEVINACQLGILPINKALFADNEHEFEFKDGLLTRYKMDSPSETASLLGMIPAAAQSLISIPAEILQLRVNYQSKDKAYYDALLEAQQSRDAYEALLLENSEEPED